MSRIGAVAGQGRETFDGVRREIAMTRQEGAKHRPSPPETGLVLDVGSGPAADPRADVLVDQDVFDVAGRGADPAPDGDRAPRPLVVADPERLPFAAQAFAYVIAVDTLVGAGDPAAAAAELARVAPRGFVQVPSRASELVYGGLLHRWIVDLGADERTLTFATKTVEPPGGEDAQAAFDESLLVRLGWAAHRSRWQHSVDWDGAPAVCIGDPPPALPAAPGPDRSPPFDVERTLVHLDEENRRSRLGFMPPAILDLLRCPASGGALIRRGRWMDCADSGLSYPVVGPVPLLLAEAAQPL